jgi:hypothetical protein
VRVAIMPMLNIRQSWLFGTPQFSQIYWQRYLIIKELFSTFSTGVPLRIVLSLSKVREMTKNIVLAQ